MKKIAIVLGCASFTLVASEAAQLQVKINASCATHERAAVPEAELKVAQDQKSDTQLQQLDSVLRDFYSKAPAIWKARVRNEQQAAKRWPCVDPSRLKYIVEEAGLFEVKACFIDCYKAQFTESPEHFFAWDITNEFIKKQKEQESSPSSCSCSCAS